MIVRRQCNEVIDFKPDFYKSMFKSLKIYLWQNNIMYSV